MFQFFYDWFYKRNFFCDLVGPLSDIYITVVFDSDKFNKCKFTKDQSCDQVENNQGVLCVAM